MADELLSPPKAPKRFVGRETELNWLTKETYSRDPYLPGAPVVVIGDAGIGKTALVAQFVTQLSERDRVLWIRCKNFSKDAPAFQVASRRGDIERSTRRVVSVLDGADEVSEEKLREIFSEITNRKIVRSVIITTRNELKLRGQRVLQLQTLTNPEAKLLIEKDSSASLISEASMEQI
jgi:predicted ATP-dependent serine protease